MQDDLGAHLRAKRLEKARTDPAFSVRKLAKRIGVQPSYLSKVELGQASIPTEARLRALARELGEDPDVLLAVAGKVSKELQEVIRNRPALFAAVLRELRDAPDHAILKVVRKVRDGSG